MKLMEWKKDLKRSNNEAIFQASMDDNSCLLYTSDAADDLLCVDLGGRRIIKKNFRKKCT